MPNYEIVLDARIWRSCDNGIFGCFVLELSNLETEIVLQEKDMLKTDSDKYRFKMEGNAG